MYIPDIIYYIIIVLLFFIYKVILFTYKWITRAEPTWKFKAFIGLIFTSLFTVLSVKISIIPLDENTTEINTEQLDDITNQSDTIIPIDSDTTRVDTTNN